MGAQVVARRNHVLTNKRSAIYSEKKVMKHKLVRKNNEWFCTVCERSFNSKSRSFCPGHKCYTDKNEIPAHLKSEWELERLNLRPTGNPQATLYKPTTEANYHSLYDIRESEIKDQTLPPVITWEEAKENGFLTEGKLKQQNLSPGATKPIACAMVWDKDNEEHIPINLYIPDECQWSPRDHYITKTQLKEAYLLSNKWIERLGKEDKIIPLNSPRYALLYSRQRVEKFLADNAKEYAEWITRRDKLRETGIKVFQENREKIKAARLINQRIKKAGLEVPTGDNKEAKKRQLVKCLECASSCVFQKGLFCVIHPLGLEDWQIPCSDYTKK